MTYYGINPIPRCPYCGDLPGFYAYYTKKLGGMAANRLLCSNCRQGPEEGTIQDPLMSWIDWVGKINAKNRN